MGIRFRLKIEFIFFQAYIELSHTFKIFFKTFNDEFIGFLVDENSCSRKNTERCHDT